MSIDTATDRVPVAPLREAFLASGVSETEMAYRLGWHYEGKGDATRLARMLGIRAYYSRGRACINETIDYDKAVLICREIGAVPREVGL